MCVVCGGEGVEGGVWGGRRGGGGGVGGGGVGRAVHLLGGMV